MEFTKFKELLRKDFGNKWISIDDLSSLNELLKAGLSLKNGMELIKNRHNEKILNEISGRLDKGELIEKIIKDYLPKEIKAYVLALVSNMSLEKSLDLALSFYYRSKENSDSLNNAILYPFVLLFVSLSSLYLFDAYGLDGILEMLKGLNVEAGVFGIFRIILRIIVYIFYFGMIITFFLYLYFVNRKNICFFYVLLANYLPNTIFQIYFCEQFISLFLICLDMGYKTKESIEVLKALHNKPVISFLAFHMEDKLLKGQSLLDASKQQYYDYALSKYINIAVYTNDFGKLLKDYVLLSRKRIKRAMKKLSLTVQVSSYALIGVMIIFIYQVLFLPMQALSKF